MKYYVLLLISILIVSCLDLDEPSEDIYLSLISSDGSNYSRISKDVTNQFTVSPGVDYIIGKRLNEIWKLNLLGDVLDIFDYDLSGIVTYASDNEHLFFSSPIDSNPDIYKLNMTNSNVEQITSTDDITETNPKYNHNNNLLIYLQFDTITYDNSIIVRDFEDNLIDTILTASNPPYLVIRDAFWSHNKIIYYRQDGINTGIYSINLDGTEETLLVDSQVQNLSVSESSNILVYEIYDSVNHYNVIHKYNLDSNEVEVVCYGLKAKISANGSKILFVNPESDIAIIDLVLNETKVLRACKEISEIDISRSGELILFSESISK